MSNQLVRPRLPDVLGAADGQQPNGNHRVRGCAFVLEVVQCTGHVRVAVVAAEVVHALAVGAVRVTQGQIPLAGAFGVNSQRDGSR